MTRKTQIITSQHKTFKQNLLMYRDLFLLRSYDLLTTNAARSQQLCWSVSLTRLMSLTGLPSTTTVAQGCPEWKESTQTSNEQTPNDHHHFPDVSVKNGVHPDSQRPPPVSTCVRKGLSIPRLPTTTTIVEWCPYRTESTQTPIDVQLYGTEV